MTTKNQSNFNANNSSVGLNTIITIGKKGEIATTTIELNRKLYELPDDAKHRITIVDNNLNLDYDSILEMAGIKVPKRKLIAANSYDHLRPSSKGWRLAYRMHEIDLNQALN